MDTHTLAVQAAIAVDSLGRRIVARRHRTVEEKIRVEEALHVGGQFLDRVQARL